MAETPWLSDAAQAAQRCEEAVALAVQACAEDTAGQTCFICLEDGSDEGLVRGCSCRGGNGFAHMSCLAEQARRSHTAANQRRRWDPDGFKKSWSLWHTCGQCKQQYHGVVKFALGWVCWKTYVGQPEYLSAMHSLAHGLYDMGNYEDALTAYKAELFVLQRHGGSEEQILEVQQGVAMTCHALGGHRRDEGLRMHRDVYHRSLNLFGEENRHTLIEANNYAATLRDQQHFEEARSVLRRMMPVAQRVIGTCYLTLVMKKVYAEALYLDDSATLDDLREAVTTLEDAERTGRRVLGGAHPFVTDIEPSLARSQAALRARDSEAPPPPAPLYDEDELE